MPYWGYLIIVGVVLLMVTGYHLALYFICKTKLFKPEKREFDFLVDYETREKGFRKEWLDLPYKEYKRKSRYGYDVFARYYESTVYTGEESTHKKIMISLHGHNSCCVSQLKYLELFTKLGYDVFIPDHRRSGKSGGDTVTFGACEKYDGIDWIDVIKKEYPDARLAIFGESMGSATAMMVSALDSRIEYIVEYCGYANFDGLMSRYVHSSTLRKMVMPSFRMVVKMGFGFDIKECDALANISKSDKPILMIHSKVDGVVDFDNFKMLSASRPDAVTHVFEDCMHARSMITHPEEFTETVSTFVRDTENKLGF